MQREKGRSVGVLEWWSVTGEGDLESWSDGVLGKTSRYSLAHPTRGYRDLCSRCICPSVDFMLLCGFFYLDVYLDTDPGKHVDQHIDCETINFPTDKITDPRLTDA